MGGPRMGLRRVAALAVCLLSIWAIPASANDAVPTLNKLAFPDIPTGKGYSFLVIGHAYGRSVSSHNLPHHLPSASLLANVKKFRELKPDFVVMLGDVYWRLETPWVEAFQKLIMDRVGVPFVNAVGNHDVTRYTEDESVVIDHAAYKRRFGQPYFTFRAGADLHIVVDTVSKPRSIVGDQKAFLEKAVERGAGDPTIRNVFFWSHHLIWTQVDRRYRWLKGDPGNWNFRSEIFPLIQRLGKSKNVIWGSGNFGEPPNSSLFYDRRAEENITFFATGIGDTRNDLFLHVAVDDAANVTIKPVSLTGGKPQPIETFDVAYNRKIGDAWFALNWDFLILPPQLNPLTLRDKLSRVLQMRFFWHGVIGASLLWIGLILSVLIVRRIVRPRP